MKWSLLLLLLTLSCSEQRMPAPLSDPSRFHPGEALLAGMAVADITPPPGLSLFGHGPESRLAVGTRLRLRCHVFLLARAGEMVALVPCELSQPSLLLEREVAARVAARVPGLGADRIILSVTHTHHGPAHYFAAKNLSGPFSSRLYGFDEDVVAFLADRISGAIARAAECLAPATARWGFREVVGLSRNRSLPALRRNETLPPTLIQLKEDHPNASEDLVHVDPRLSVLRLAAPDAQAGCPAEGVYAIFGVHPSVVGSDDELYHGDLFGYATRAAERSLAIPNGRVMVAMANGIEGDISPVASDKTPLAARRLGERLAREIVEAYRDAEKDPSPDPARPALRFAYRELDLPGKKTTTLDELCRNPALGAAAAGGADDHPVTVMRAFDRLRPGSRLRQEHGCHGPKVPVQQVISGGAAGTYFPRVAPIAQLELGRALLVMVPAEVTTVTGLRIRDGVQAIANERRKDAPPTVVLVGLAYEYLQYIATREEYAEQGYEGASTIYGPHSAEYFREQHEALAVHLLSDMTGPQTSSLEAVKFSPAALDRFCPASECPRDPPSPPQALGAPQYVRLADGRLGIEVQWRAAPLPQGRVEEGPELRLRVREGKETIDDDDGPNLELRFLHASDDRWCTVWTPPAIPCGRHFRLELGYAGQPAVPSQEISLACGAPPPPAAGCRAP